MSMKMTTKLFFIRHGNTSPGTNDDTRVLSEKGIAQAKRRGEILNRKFDAVFVSPKKRALETAKLITGGDGNVSSTVIPYLFTPQDRDYGKFLTAMAERLAYASLRDYYSSAADVFGEHKALETYKHESWLKVLTAIIENDEDGAILVVGHAVLLPLLGFGATGSADFLPIQMGECEGFILELEDRLRVVKHTFIKD